MKLNSRNKLVFGVGTNDADYNVYKCGKIDGKKVILWVCPFYVKWVHMLRRCYSEVYQRNKPTYVGCSVVEEWHLFSTFKAWMEQQDWQGKELDKDILCDGNKVYSSDYCVFVDQKVNAFFNDHASSRGEYPIGVNWYPRYEKYCSRCHSVETGKQKHLGYYNTPEEAHAAWLAFKLGQAYILANQQTDERVAKALISKYENFTDI